MSVLGIVPLIGMKPVHEGYSSDRMQQFCSELIQRVEVLSGVRVAALSDSGGPLSQREGSVPIHIPNTRSDVGEGVTVIADRASPGFFEALGVSFILGCDFPSADREGAVKVAIVDENAATTSSVDPTRLTVIYPSRRKEPSRVSSRSSVWRNRPSTRV